MQKKATAVLFLSYLESHDVSQQKQVPPVDGDAIGLHDVRDLLGDDDPRRLHAKGLEHLQKWRRGNNKYVHKDVLVSYDTFGCVCG